METKRWQLNQWLLMFQTFTRIDWTAKHMYVHYDALIDQCNDAKEWQLLHDEVQHKNATTSNTDVKQTHTVT